MKTARSTSAISTEKTKTNKDMKHSVLVFYVCSRKTINTAIKKQAFTSSEIPIVLIDSFLPCKNHALKLLGTTPSTAHPAPAASEMNGRNMWYPHE